MGLRRHNWKVAEPGVKPRRSGSRCCGPNRYAWEAAIEKKTGKWGGGSVLPPAQCLAKGIRHMNSLSPYVYSNTTGILTSFAGEETKAQRSQLTCPKRHSQKMLSAESNLTLLCQIKVGEFRAEKSAKCWGRKLNTLRRMEERKTMEGRT